MMLRALRVLGALALFGIGAVHLQEYLGAGYSAIPTIGTLFLLNAISSGLVGVALLSPIERVLSERRAGVAIGLLATAGVAIAAGALVALFISESGALFGFTESGYRTVIVLAIVAEAATIVFLGPLAFVSLTRAVRRAATTRTTPRRTETFPPHRPAS